MQTVTLSTFPLPDNNGGEREEPYWQVMVGGSPAIRETTDQAAATAAFHRIVAELSTHGRKVTRAYWDGFNCQTTAL